MAACLSQVARLTRKTRTLKCPNLHKQGRHLTDNGGVGTTAALPAGVCPRRAGCTVLYRGGGPPQKNPSLTGCCLRPGVGDAGGDIGFVGDAGVPVRRTGETGRNTSKEALWLALDFGRARSRQEDPGRDDADGLAGWAG